MIVAVIAMSLAQFPVIDRTYEGDWYVSDDTDNNTGQRKVYAFRTYIKQNDPNYVTITLRCSDGKPTMFVEWDNVSFPDQAVLTIGPVSNPTSAPSEEQYVFKKSEDLVERGLRATPSTSARIVAAMGTASYTTVTAHLASGRRTVGMDINGTTQAWSRVSRNCPVRLMPQPPL